MNRAKLTIIQAIPGVIEYQGARIQLLDLPGIVEGASQGNYVACTQEGGISTLIRSWTWKTGRIEYVCFVPV